MNQINQLINETKKYLRKYDYTSIIKCCDTILKLKPDSSFALKFKAISYHQTDNTEEAIKYYEKLQQINPEDHDVIYSLATLYEERGNYQEALFYYNKLNKEDKRIENKYKRLSTKMNRYDVLIKECEEKIKINKNCNYRIMGLLEEKSVFFYSKGEYNEAYEVLKTVMYLYPMAIKEHRNPRYHNTSWYNRLEDYLEKYSDSEKFFKHFFEVDDVSIWSSRLKHSLTLADEYVFADVLLELNPSHIELLEVYAEGAKYSNPDYALECFYKMLEIDPENENAIDSIIQLYEDNYAKDKAVKFIDSKLYIKEMKKHLLRTKINLLESMTLYKKALKTYDEYFNYKKPRTRPFLTDFDKIRCMEKYSIELYNMKKYNEAYSILIEVKEIYQKMNKNTIINIEECEMNDWYNEVLSESINNSNNNPLEFFKEFYEPDDVKSELWVKKIHFLHNNSRPHGFIRYPEATSYCDAILSRSPDNYMILLAKAYTITHPSYDWQRAHEALKIYDKVLDIKPDNMDALVNKFNLLVYIEEDEKAYQLLEKNLNYHDIHYNLQNLVDSLISNKKYLQAKYCLELMLKEEYDVKILSLLKDVWNKCNDSTSQEKSIFYNDWIDIIKFKHDKYECPVCHNKLMPIEYGVIVLSEDKFLKENVHFKKGLSRISNNRPTDYCLHCDKEFYMGFCGINLTEDNEELADYTKEVLVWFIKYLEEHPESTIEQIKKDIFTKYSLDEKELETLTDKLEEINFIQKSNEHILLKGGYESFKNTILQNKYDTIKKFKDRRELNEYTLTCKEFKDYGSYNEYWQDVLICLMANWNLKKNDALKEMGEEYIKENYRNRNDADDVAWNLGYHCG